MKTLTLYQVDAFTDELFKGNPAAVCVLENALSKSTMQIIAAENNLSETAFVRKLNGIYEIRWFTPKTEVDLCGHATLSSAYILFNELDHSKNEITFQSIESGMLHVKREKDILTLDFPADIPKVINMFNDVEDAIGIKPVELFKGKNKLLAILESEIAVQELQPDMHRVKQLNAMGIIVSARGNTVDFVSRFFVPQVGIDEDPVTGSAHCLLTPYWSNKLGKKELHAKQLSHRGGSLWCTDMGDRVAISGKAKLYLKGEIYVA